MSNPPDSNDPAIVVTWVTTQGTRQARFTRAFCIGSDVGGELQVDDEHVARSHAAVHLRNGQWWVRDLGSTEGTVLDGAQIQAAPLPRRAVLGLGAGGLQVTLEVEQKAAQTVLHGSAPRQTVMATSSGDLPIRVQTSADSPAREFTGTIRVGRDPTCTIRIDGDGASRMHVEIFRAGALWCARDLGSSNGTYLDGRAITEAPLPGRCTLRLGPDGPKLELSYEAPALAASDVGSPRSLEEFAAHYLDGNSKAPAGDRTMMVRRAFSTVQTRQKRRYGSVIAGVAVLLLVAVGVGTFQYFQLQRSRALAEQLFYNMKTIELQLARLETQVQASADAAQRAEVEKGHAQLAQMTTEYDALLEELGVLDDSLPPEDQLILRMARLFGECELAMPRDFVAEVKRYIGIWRSDRRLVDAIEKAQEQNLAPEIARIMREHRMPPQFFYVALQESDFRHDAVGPATRFGIAKGMWQFMPETATHYGLQTGPLLAEREFDPDDQRFDSLAASNAAARYLSDLYRGEAQASGLLVLASYNWGTTRVRNRIRAMKENPRDRNFWALLAQTDVPTETRDYVFLIFAAAVIGEDPKLFGFEFDKPLADGEPGSTVRSSTHPSG